VGYCSLIDIHKNGALNEPFSFAPPMQYTIILPDLGQTTSEAKIVQWLKKPGDHTSRGEPILAVETDKVDVEVEAFESGYIRELLVSEGSMVSALAPVAILTDTPNEDYHASVRDKEKPAATEPAPQPAAPSAPKARRGDSAPAARVLAKELGVDLAQVVGTGPKGLVTRADVQQFAESDKSPSVMAETTITQVPALSNEDRVRMFRRMLLCRMFEDRVYYLFLQGRMPGTIHQAQGQEACAVGVCSALQPGDMITSTHRPHEHAVARGVPVNSLMAELFAKTDGCCRGKGGSMHLGDVAYGMLPAIAIVGGGIPLAAGYALAFKYRKTGNVVGCFFGDGATNIGSFHEAVNISAIWDLPVIFVCENNKYGASTSIEKVTRVPRLSERAAAYGIPGRTVDGNDVEAVYAAMVDACERARGGAGPTLLELETYRFAGHSRSDPGHYRSKDEVAHWKSRDPLSRYEKFLLTGGILSPGDVEELKASVEKELDAAVAFAEASPSPHPEDCLNDVYAV
jgi:pyruvate dehydrogenase E1 component alpha subunit